MNPMQHPENTNNSFSPDRLAEALKLREIWQDSLRHENSRIRFMLQEAWFPYFVFIRKYLSNVNPNYELESNIFISDKTRLVPPSQFMEMRSTEPTISLTFYWIPQIVEDTIEEDMDFEIIPVDFNKKQEAYILKILNKFSEEIGLPVNVIYE